MDVPAQPHNQPLAASTTTSSPSSASAGPQIRARITVVCAECKRLKLKCDRRTPCGSCTKRDTVARCIYSPAAAEKVDLHSLNNRLIQVEAILEMITKGQIPPTFQSLYTLPNSSGSAAAQQTIVSTSSHAQGHQHHHHYAVPAHTSPYDSLSLTFDDLAAIWLDELDLGAYSSPSASYSHLRQRSLSNPENMGMIKLEPSPIDIELSQPRTTPHIISSGRPTSFSSRAPSPVSRNLLARSEHHNQQQQQRSSAQLLLPALSIYYPTPSIAPGTSTSSAHYAHHPANASSASTSSSTSSPTMSANYGYDASLSPQTQSSRPQVTQALIALLPSIPVGKLLLQNARQILRLRPIPFEGGPEQGWKHFEERCLTLLGGGASKARAKEREKKEREKEKAREARRARQIYFGGIPGLQPHATQDTDMDDVGTGSGKGGSKTNTDTADEGEEMSLAFFALMCTVLAMGASVPAMPGSPLHSSTNMDENVRCTPAFLFALSQQALGVWDTYVSAMTFGSAVTAAAQESEKMDYLLACIAGVCYLLFSDSPMRTLDSDCDGGGVTGLIYPLVGKLVTAARGMGLDKDAAMPPPLSRKAKSTLDGPGERHGTPHVTGPGASGTGTSKHPSKREREAERERIREEWKKMIWSEVMFYDLFTADAQGQQPHIPAHLFGITLPRCSSTPPSSSDEQNLDEDGMGLHPNESYSNDGYRTSSVESDIYERERDYIVARHRLTRLAYNVKVRLSRPDCCCGFTLDQAVQLETEVRRWQTTLPIPLRWSEYIVVGPDPPPSSFHSAQGSDTEKIAHLQSCELSVMCNLLLMKIYTPFLRHISSTGVSKDAPGSSTGSSVHNTPTPETSAIGTTAAQTTLHAAQMIIRAVKDAYATQAAITTYQTSTSSFSSPSASPGKTPAWPAVVSPPMFDLYPLDKVVFHAAMVCAHAGLGKARGSVDVDGALHDATVALRALLIEQGAPSVGPLGNTQRGIADTLFKRVSARTNAACHGMKRKHSQVNLNNPFGAVMQTSVHLGSAINLPSPIREQATRAGSGDYSSNNANRQQNGTPKGTPVLPSNFPHDRLARTEQQKEDLAASGCQALADHTVRDEAEKEKKYAKKHSYPSVGFRVRPNKDTHSRPRRDSRAHSNGSQPKPSATRTVQIVDALAAYQQQHKQQQQQQQLQVMSEPVTPSSSNVQAPPPTTPADYEQALNRSRSSSFSHVQAQQQQASMHHRTDSSAEDMHYPYFGAAAQSDMMNAQVITRKRYSVHEQAGVQPQQQQQQQQAPPSEHPPFNIYEHTAQSMYEQPFERPSGSGVEGMGYSTVSSPFSNGGPASSSGSPFTTTSVVSSGHPPTPTFGPHHAPVYGPQPLEPLNTSSPTTYFHTSTMFNETTYPGQAGPATHHSHQSHGTHVLSGVNMDQNNMDIPAAPSYEKAAQHQGTVYDMKPNMEQQIPHQQGQMQQQTMEQSYEDQNMDGHGQSNELDMAMPQSASWAVAGQHPPAQNQPYWNNGAEYRFYS